MVLPHLDEMRRMVTQHEVCLDEGPAILQLFPVAGQPALRGCQLVAPENEGMTFSLQCNENNGASGRLSFRREGEVVVGELEAKIGGKNMTFSQFVRVRRSGDCSTN